MAINVGRVPYLSCEPIYFDMERRGLNLIPLVPSAMAAAVQEGQIDAAPFPVVDCARLEAEFNYMTSFCVATISSAGSVILNSTKPIQELAGARIGVSEEAATAPKLLRVLLTQKYQVEPATYVSPQESAEALLHIGNQGLRNRRGMRGFAHQYDLGSEWHDWTGMPFVFSRWMVRKDLEPSQAAVVEDSLYVGVQDWADGLFHLSESRDSLRMHPQDMLTYIQGMCYFMGVPEQRGLDRFLQCLEKLQTDPLS